MGTGGDGDELPCGQMEMRMNFHGDRWRWG